MRKILAVLAVLSMCYAPEAFSSETRHIPVRASDTYEGLAIDVRDFGARGDGKTDDTDAIKAAVSAGFQRRRMPNHPEYRYFTSFAEIYFPSGHYIISDTIDINSVNIRGEAYAAIEQINPEKDIFFNAQAWRQKISGITFLGGKVHLNLGNPNTDTGLVVVRDCHFYHSRDVSVLLRVGSDSTLFKIEDCVFRNCEQAIVSYTDETSIRDVWISTSPDMDGKAAIVNKRGVMQIDNLVGVPRATGFDQRWIDNHGRLAVYNTRFGGEHGGFTPVVNFSKFTPEAGGNWVIIDSSWVSAESNYKRRAAVYCEEVPNKISIRNSILVGVPPIKVCEDIDLRRYFEGARPGMLVYSVTDCVGERAEEIPPLLKRPVLRPKRDINQLSPRETRQALQRAVAEVLARDWEEPDELVHNLRNARTAEGSFIEITPSTHNWDLSDFRDATAERNSEYLAVAQAGDDTLILKRQERGWPHVFIRNVNVDIDKYPYLTWRLKDAVEGSPNRHAVRVIDRESERMIVVSEAGHGVEYQAYNIRERLGVEGARTLDIKFYFLGSKYIGPGTEERPYHTIHAQPGEYMILDFLRFEKE